MDRNGAPSASMTARAPRPRMILWPCTVLAQRVQPRDASLKPVSPRASAARWRRLRMRVPGRLGGARNRRREGPAGHAPAIEGALGPPDRALAPAGGVPRRAIA